MIELLLQVDVFAAAAVLVDGLLSDFPLHYLSCNENEEKYLDSSIAETDNTTTATMPTTITSFRKDLRSVSGGVEPKKNATKVSTVATTTTTATAATTKSRKVRKIRSQSRRSFPTQQIRRKGKGGSRENEVKQKSNIANAIVEDKYLAEKARDCLVSTLESMVKLNFSEGIRSIHWGGATLIMRAYALLVYRAGIGAGSSPGSGSKFVERAMRAIHALVAVVVTQQNQ
eukprot:8175100-Ditylum_brightwellii.AAC.1